MKHLDGVMDVHNFSRYSALAVSMINEVRLNWIYWEEILDAAERRCAPSNLMKKKLDLIELDPVQW